MKLLLVADVPGWAWDHKADAIRKHLADRFECIDKIYTKQISRERLERYDAIHFFGWKDGLRFARMATAGVSSHNFEVKHRKIAEKKMHHYRAVTAVCKMIQDKLKPYHSKVYLCENGVDETLFHPQAKRGGFTVGWVGQPSSKLDQHGYHTIWKPLRAELERRNIAIKERACTWKTAVPQSQMPRFYCDCDVFVHTGIMTGTPNPVFEAAACGRAVVSTRIGAAPEMISDGWNGFIVDISDDRTATVNALLDKITWLYANADACAEMGRRARAIIEKSWTWKQRALDWLPVLNNHRRSAG